MSDLTDDSCPLCHPKRERGGERGVEPTELCNTCAHEVLDEATEFEIDGFVNVERQFNGTYWVLIGEDTGPSIETHRFGPFSLADAIGLARAYAADNDMEKLREAAKELTP